MLANFEEKAKWWYMEVPRTGTSTIERTLRHVFPEAKAVYAKHWPLKPPQPFYAESKNAVSVRNPYSRALSCWQYFTVPGEISFVDWLKQRKKDNFYDVAIEARPQSFWLDTDVYWEFRIRQEELQKDFWNFVHAFCPEIEAFPLRRYNDINGHWVNRVRQKTSRTKPWESYFSPEAIHLVQELYAGDFERLSDLYEYDFPGVLIPRESCLSAE